MSILWFLCRLVFGAVFVYAGAQKMADPAAFALVIFNYQMLPAKLVYGAALVLPPLEVACGFALWVNSLARGASVILNVLMAAFMGAMGLAMARGLDVSCGCFGGAGAQVSKETMIRDAVILVIGLVAMWGAFAQAKKGG